MFCTGGLELRAHGILLFVLLQVHFLLSGQSLNIGHTEVLGSVQLGPSAAWGLAWLSWQLQAAQATGRVTATSNKRGIRNYIPSHQAQPALSPPRLGSSMNQMDLGCAEIVKMPLSSCN